VPVTAEAGQVETLPSGNSAYSAPYPAAETSTAPEVPGTSVGVEMAGPTP
jgi:hypothetical protein